MKLILRTILLLAVAALLGYVFIGMPNSSKEILCNNIRITIEDSLNIGLVHEEDVHAILAKNNIAPKGMALDKINMGKIDSCLSESPFIDTAKCYHTPTGELCVEVASKQPLVHVMAQNGEEYYLDRKGNTMPMSQIDVNLQIITGKVSKKFAQEKLVPMVHIISEDPFWNKQIEQIHVIDEKHIDLYTRIGDHVIKFGTPTLITDKLKRLEAFYQQGLNQAGWNLYSSISLEYGGMILCEKSDEKKTY